jgi:hypothetical protein
MSLPESIQKMVLEKGNLESDWFRSLKIAAIEQCAAQYGSLPKQGTEEWKRLRMGGFGGSELASLMGDNPYSSLKELIASKVGLLEFNGNLATRWGNMFENITEILVRTLFDAKLWELSSVPGFCDHHRFSPDGLGVMQVKCHGVVAGKQYTTLEWLAVLLEYKAPFSSIPKGIIPKHYLAQVMGGMCNFPFVDAALFVNNTYKVCKRADFAFNGAYNRHIHVKDIGKHNPLAAGVILFRQSDEQRGRMLDTYGGACDPGSDESSDEEDTPEQKLCGPMVDYGKLSAQEFDRFVMLAKQGYLTADCGEPLIFHRELRRIPTLDMQDRIVRDKRDYNQAMKQHADARWALRKTDHTIVGALPWKLLISDMIFKTRDDSYKKELGPRIAHAAAILHKITDPIEGEHPDIKAIYDRFYAHFSRDNSYIDRRIDAALQ